MKSIKEALKLARELEKQTGKSHYVWLNVTGFYTVETRFPLLGGITWYDSTGIKHG